MKFAAAQTIPKDGDIEANIADHVRLAKQAAEKGAMLIVFPEMSLTGYARATAQELAFEQHDNRLDVLKKVTAQHNIVIVAGAPITLNAMLHIGTFITHPNGSIDIYTKQFLHDGEEEFFSSSDKYNPVIILNNDKASCAICADITNPVHPANAKKNDASIYLASLFYTPDGIQEGYGQLSDYAWKYNMHVLMANYGGPSCGFASGGSSAYWNNKGALIAKTTREGEALLLVTKEN